MIEIIAALDLLGAAAVRLYQGDYSRKTTYAAAPLELAQRLEAEGLQRLHLVDLDGARLGRPVNQSLLEEIAAATRLRLDYSGGLRNTPAVAAALAAGARQVTIGSTAVLDTALFVDWLERFGAEQVILAADERCGQLAVSGWQKRAALSVEELVERCSAGGLQYLLCTAIERDGTLRGPAIQQYRSLRRYFPHLKLIASGGVSKIEQIEQLHDLGVHGVVIGRALYEGQIRLAELSRFLV